MHQRITGFPSAGGLWANRLVKRAVCLGILVGLFQYGPAQNTVTPLRPLPSARQLSWEDLEFCLFVHFGPNTLLTWNGEREMKRRKFLIPPNWIADNGYGLPRMPEPGGSLLPPSITMDFAYGPAHSAGIQSGKANGGMAEGMS